MTGVNEMGYHEWVDSVALDLLEKLRRQQRELEDRGVIDPTHDAHVDFATDVADALYELAVFE